MNCFSLESRLFSIRHLRLSGLKVPQLLLAWSLESVSECNDGKSTMEMLVSCFKLECNRDLPVHAST